MIRNYLGVFLFIFLKRRPSLSGSLFLWEGSVCVCWGGGGGVVITFGFYLTALENCPLSHV